MNPWCVLMTELFVFALLSICFIAFLIMLIKAKKQDKSIKTIIVLLTLDIIIFVCSTIFTLSHPTYYKYNDWVILNSDINTVTDKYGAYDKGKIQKGKSGKIGYYIYTDNGPIMPDHTDHYYWIYFDEYGIVYKVEDNTPPGG